MTLAGAELEAIDPRRNYTAEEVARLAFGHRIDWFRKHLRRMTIEEGFPGPISRFSRPLRWHGDDLLAWLARDKRQGASPAGNVTDLTPLLKARARLVASR